MSRFKAILLVLGVGALLGVLSATVRRSLNIPGNSLWAAAIAAILVVGCMVLGIAISKRLKNESTPNSPTEDNIDAPVSDSKV